MTREPRVAAHATNPAARAAGFVRTSQCCACLRRLRGEGGVEDHFGFPIVAAGKCIAGLDFHDVSFVVTTSLS
jgi:hypothetical protein